MIKKILLKWNNLKKKFYTTIEQQVVEIKEKPYKIALGCALGIGINFIPTFGVGFIIAYFLAMIFGVNRAGAAVTSLVTGPLVPLMYALNFVVGGVILTPALGDESIVDFIIRQYSMILKLGSIREKILSSLELLGFTFLMGSAINAVVLGLAFYFFVMFLMRKYKS
ncbi:MAG: DUF2062 domain-containing protein [Clostridia bacterium]|nr:DUF2062 domain-containing protein [Clostridia bacterium]